MLLRNSSAYTVKCIRTKSQKHILDIFQLDWYLTPLYSFVISLLWRVFDIRILRLESTVAIMILLVSISWIFSLHVYATPDHSTSNATSQPLTNDNSTTSGVPSVLHLSSVPSNNGTSSTSEPSTNNKADANSATGSNSGTAHTHHDTGTSSTSSSTSTHHNDNTKSHDLAQKIINKIKQKFKVGDVPFP